MYKIFNRDRYTQALTLSFQKIILGLNPILSPNSFLLLFSCTNRVQKHIRRENTGCIHNACLFCCVFLSKLSLRIFYSLLMKFFQGIEVDLYFLGKHGENMQKLHLYLQEHVPQTSQTQLAVLRLLSVYRDRRSFYVLDRLGESLIHDFSLIWFTTFSQISCYFSSYKLESGITLVYIHSLFISKYTVTIFMRAILVISE